MSQKRLVIHESEGKVVPDICGTAIEMINAETAGSSKISFAKLIIEPGVQSRRHFHKETEEIYYILSGQGKVEVGNDTFDIGPGHAIFLPLNVSHQIFNTGDQKLVFVCADAPVFDTSDVIED